MQLRMIENKDNAAIAKIIRNSLEEFNAVKKEPFILMKAPTISAIYFPKNGLLIL
jgi:hypothetical protein